MVKGRDNRLVGEVCIVSQGENVMSLEGRIHDGTVVFSEPVTLAEGTRVRVEPLTIDADSLGETGSLLVQLGDVVGAVDDLPSDLASQHDYYLYGTPKR